MRLLVVSDCHAQATAAKRGRGDLAATLFAKAITHATQSYGPLDQAVILGDICHDQSAERAHFHITSILAQAAQVALPTLCVRGNHDPAGDDFVRLTGTPPGLHVCQGIGLYVLNESYTSSRIAYPITDWLDHELSIIRATYPDLPLVVLQHGPAVDAQAHARRPDESQLVPLYAKHHVALVLSGHDHDGHPPHDVMGVMHYCVPTIYRAPFACAVVEISDNGLAIHPLQLAAPQNWDWIDYHAHTEFAYCGRGIEVAKTTSIAQSLGLRYQGIAEHACALYFSREHMMNFDWLDRPGYVQEIWDSPTRGRMVAYKKWITLHRSPFVLASLEVDLFDKGRLNLAPQDADDWDYLIGAIHEIQGISAATPQTETIRAFMRDIEAFCQSPIRILAHPMRYFAWHGRPVPSEIYRPVAKMLKQANIAAEINHHKNPFDPLFFRICLEEGVKLSWGTDAHITNDIANLWPHMRTLQAIGITTPDAARAVMLSPEML